MSDPIDSFRWQSFFQHAAQPIFLLNRRRRLLFVNRAWEACTGLSLADVRGRVCRRRATDEADDAIFRACAPPADAMRGETVRVRRRAPARNDWWEIQFMPLAGAQELLGILGTIHVIAGLKETPFALPEQLMALRDVQAARYRLADLEANDPAMKRLAEQAQLAAATHVPLTFVGEAGVGKQWLARAIHLRSERRHRYFITLDAEKLPAALIGEVLFDARSRPLAPGTIYLREPGLLPRELQGRLAETLTTHAEFPRLMLGMCRDPREEVRTGRLLEELSCAAGTMVLQLPPLRERLTELLRFVEIFLQRQRGFALNPGEPVIAAETLNVLRSHKWPENLRELQEVLRSAASHAKKERIEVIDLPFHLKNAPLPPERRLPLDAILEQVERRLITLAMKLTQDNQTRAAELLEIWRPRLLRRLEKFAEDDKQKLS